MTLLAQQELLTPPPSTRIIVPAGCNSHWGVDPSTLRLAVATITPDGARHVETISYPVYTGASRLAAIFSITRAYARALAITVPPGLILVEQPSGHSSRGVNHELEFAVGVAMAALYDGTFSALGHGVDIRMKTSAWWKKRACGRGDIYKPTKKKLGRTPRYEDYGVAVWARENGYHGDSYDEADAWAICEAGRREYALEER